MKLHEDMWLFSKTPSRYTCPQWYFGMSHGKDTPWPQKALVSSYTLWKTSCSKLDDTYGYDSCLSPYLMIAVGVDKVASTAVSYDLNFPCQEGSLWYLPICAQTCIIKPINIFNVHFFNGVSVNKFGKIIKEHGTSILLPFISRFVLSNELFLGESPSTPKNPYCQLLWSSVSMYSFWKMSTLSLES